MVLTIVYMPLCACIYVVPSVNASVWECFRCVRPWDGSFYNTSANFCLAIHVTNLTKQLFVLAGSLLSVRCSSQNFRQGGQGLAEGACGDNVCALCETEDTPCPKCWQGNPTATVCDCPNDHVWFDEQHTTEAFNKILARAIFQCSQDAPKTNWPWVKELCAV